MPNIIRKDCVRKLQPMNLETLTPLEHHRWNRMAMPLRRKRFLVFGEFSALGQGTPQFAFPVLRYVQHNIQFTFWEIKGSNGSN